MWQRRDFIRTTVGVAGAAALASLPAEAAHAAGARVVGEKKLSARVRDLTVYSPAMKRNMKVRIILPKGWSRKRSWPLLWLLHGGHDGYTAWTRNSKIIQKSAGKKMIVVMPEGGEGGGYTNWLVGPQWETFHMVELRALLMSRYRAGRRQAIAGVSAGGYGALIYSARHHKRFVFTACFSGYGSTRIDGAAEVLLTGIPGSGTEKFLMWGQPQINEDIWKAHDPVYMARGLRGSKIYISCAKNGVKGPLDPPTAQAVDPAEAFCYYTSKPLVSRLHALKIPVTTHFYPKGTHNWRYWRRELDRIWPYLCKALKA
ncbi:alpha/beta hydrolase family protein [Actinocorallia longicatena]|uniref:Acyl-CoA:diacylglycerol acyltransferase n=1 Tax=Actinocorallia longicatena TaxID=111803 RepID=A0ABP6PYI8_9ACTN